MEKCSADARSEIVSRLQREAGNFKWSYRLLDRARWELSIPGHRPVTYAAEWNRFSGGGLIQHGAHEPVTTYVISRIIELARPANTFDVGASAGYFSLLMASHTLVPTTVHAFEVQPDRAQRLEENVRNNPNLADRQIRLNAIGLTDVSRGVKQVWFYKSRMFETEPHSSKFRSSMRSRIKYLFMGDASDEALRRASMELMSLDDFCEQQGVEPDLLKIDVDGYEGNVVQGGKKLLRRRRPWVVMEIHREKLLAPHGTNRRRVVLDLLDLGYRAILLVGRRSLNDLRWIPIDSSRLAQLDTTTTDLLLLF
jgi:FkbM family methyltransferase